MSFVVGTFTAQVGDNSAIDRRLSSLLGLNVTYRIAEDQSPLLTTRGLFVNTPAFGALSYYAVTAERVGYGHDRNLVSGQNATAAAVWERVQKPKPVWQRTLEHPPAIELEFACASQSVR